MARTLADKKPTLRRDVVFVALSGEEQGAAGADAFVKHPPGGLAAKDIVAMVNLDMVGRLRDNTVQVFGEDTATQWPDLVSGGVPHAPGSTACGRRRAASEPAIRTCSTRRACPSCTSSRE